MLFWVLFPKSTTCFNFSTLHLKRFWSGKGALRSVRPLSRRLRRLMAAWGAFFEKAQATFLHSTLHRTSGVPNSEKNMGDIIGWETDVLNGSSMSITFKMSSQLWVTLSLSEEVRRFIVGSCNVDIGRKCDYIQLYRINREACQDDSAGVSLSLS